MNILYENSSFHIFHDCIRLRHPIQPTPQHNTSSPTLLLPLLDNTTYIYQYFNQIAKTAFPIQAKKRNNRKQKGPKKKKENGLLQMRQKAQIHPTRHSGRQASERDVLRE